ncbi:Uncharacterised protein [Enterobacter cloacae]|nr:Uncharacterised protein [Enterobacter cloacae]
MILKWNKWVLNIDSLCIIIDILMVVENEK